MTNKETVKNNSLAVGFEWTGKLSPRNSKTATKINKTLNKWAKKRIDERIDSSEKLIDFMFPPLLITKRRQPDRYNVRKIY